VNVTVLVDAMIDTIIVLFLSIPPTILLWGMVECLKDAIKDEEEIEDA